MSDNFGLDLDKIKHRISKNITTEESLKDITPLDIPSEVLNGEKEMLISKPIIDNGKVGISIKYV